MDCSLHFIKYCNYFVTIVINVFCLQIIKSVNTTKVMLTANIRNKLINYSTFSIEVQSRRQLLKDIQVTQVFSRGRGASDIVSTTYKMCSCGRRATVERLRQNWVQLHVEIPRNREQNRNKLVHVWHWHWQWHTTTLCWHLASSVHSRGHQKLTFIYDTIICEIVITKTPKIQNCWRQHCNVQHK
jgi:hypothetical protein